MHERPSVYRDDGFRRRRAIAQSTVWPLVYTLAWISVAGGNSVMPPWVRHQFPEASKLVRRLRDTPCTDHDCTWCRAHNDPNALLKRWFGFDSFRPHPEGPDGRPLQESIVATRWRQGRCSFACRWKAAMDVDLRGLDYEA